MSAAASGGRDRGRGAEPLVELVEAARAGSRRALGRVLTAVEGGGSPADEIDRLVSGWARQAPIVGVTGAPGAGKSTLTGRLVAALVDGGGTVAVVAVDPTSPFSGGAILGDRVRMDELIGDRRASVFVRSMATRGHEGGLALAVPAVVRVFDAMGFDRILVETVGVGQVEVEVAGAADTTVVVVTPGWGDAVQAAKAGLLEVADVFVVNKADRPGAADTVRDLERMLDLAPGASDAGGWRPPVLTTVATRGEGIEELVAALDAHHRHLVASGDDVRRRAGRRRREVRERALAMLGRRLDALLDVGAGVGSGAPDGVDGSSPVRVEARRLVERLVGDGSGAA